MPSYAEAIADVIFFCRCIAKANWKFLNWPWHFIADVLSTDILLPTYLALEFWRLNLVAQTPLKLNNAINSCLINKTIISYYSYITFVNVYYVRFINNIVCDFSGKGLKRAKYFKTWQKYKKFENILKKGSLMRVTIACMKQLEYAFISLVIFCLIFSILHLTFKRH